MLISSFVFEFVCVLASEFMRSPRGLRLVRGGVNSYFDKEGGGGGGGGNSKTLGEVSGNDQDRFNF